jgi:NitT/TauT family transport system substrate-binding protein
VLFAGAFIGMVAESAAEAQTAAGAKKQISLRFSWKLKGEYGPLYVALDKGYFAEEGLDVKLNEGAGIPAAFASLMKNEDQISWMPAIYMMQARSKGMPAKVIAMYNEAAPIFMVSWPDKPIRTPKDMEGKRIATAAGDTSAHFMPIICKRNNVDCSKVQLINLALGAQVQAFIGRQVDGIGLYATNDLPIILAKNGKDFVLMDQTKYGMRLPSGSLVATDEMIAKDPETLVKFIRATNKGMEFARKDPMEAAKSMLKYWKASLEPEIVAEQIKAGIVSMPDYKGKPMGYVDIGLVRAALNDLKEGGMIDDVLPLESYYTNAIVDRTVAKTN